MHGTRVGELGDGRGRPDRRHRRPLRRPRDRRARRVRAAARRSSTSTSTRPRSARTSPVHIPIVGDAQARARGAARARYAQLDADAARLARVVGADPRLAGRAPAARARAARTAAWRRRRRSTRCAGQLGDAIVTTDVGQHQMWAAEPAALRGAAALDHLRRARHDGLRPAGRARRPGRAARTRPVVCVSGEGSFLMNVQELATAVEERAAGQGRCCSTTPRSAWSASSRTCSGAAAAAPSTSARAPDWELLARAFGVAGALDRRRATRSSDALARDARRGRPGAAARPRSPPRPTACRCSARAARPGR